MAPFDDVFAREVYCIFGLPVDNVDWAQVIERTEAAIKANKPFLVSTPNINFVVNATNDNAFRETLVFSDLCLPDGMWLVWLGRLLGIPVKQRIAGSDLLEALKRRRSQSEPLKVCLFGGADEIAEKARDAINAREDGMECVTVVNPGFGSVGEMSGEPFMTAVNAEPADFLLVALGAKKGQLWLRNNHDRIDIPVRAHLGATINFYAGAVKRAPAWLQRIGLEWMWRVKEEPNLWRRYVHDAAVVGSMLFTRVAPLVLWLSYVAMRRTVAGGEVTASLTLAPGRRTLALAGALTAENAEVVAAALRSLARENEECVLDLSGARAVDARFAGQLCMLRKVLAQSGRAPRIENAPLAVRWALALYGIEVSGAAAMTFPLAAPDASISMPNEA